MTATITASATLAEAPHGRDLRGPLDTIRSEWTKLRTVRTTWYCLLVVLAGSIAVGGLVSAAFAAHWAKMSATERATFDPTFRSLSGLFLAQLAVGVLGVLVITAEYSSGMIRSTLAAVPDRREVLAAKVAALAPVALVVSTIACIGSFLVGQAILSGKGLGVSIAHPAVLRAVLGGGLYLTALALFGLGLGTICRRTAAGLSAFVGLVLVAPIVVRMLPSSWGNNIAKFLPSEAGQALVSVRTVSNQLAPWTGFAVLCAWTAAALVVGGFLIARRDA
jgi:ABC-type transport system involved in multi-copper enzyme maturation permease subunit